MVSVVLPTYNERDNICPLINRIIAAVSGPLEILVVDDRSPDGTAGVVEEVFGGDKRVRTIIRSGPRSLRKAIERGIREARGEYIAWMDADLSMPPETLPQLLEPVRSNICDMAVGSRYVKNGADRRHESGHFLLRVHTILSRAMTLFASLLLYRGFRDWTSGFVAGRAECIKGMRMRGDYGEFFIDMIYRLIKQGKRVAEVPYQLMPRPRGTSKTATNIGGFLRRGITYVGTTIRLRYFPDGDRKRRFCQVKEN